MDHAESPDLVYRPDAIQMDCPLEIKKYILTRSQNSSDPSISIWLLNATDAGIRSFQLRIECLDASKLPIDSHLQPLVISNQDIDFLGKTEYPPIGWIRLTGRPETASVRIVIEKVDFSDGTSWFEEPDGWLALPAPIDQAKVPANAHTTSQTKAERRGLARVMTLVSLALVVCILISVLGLPLAKWIYAGILVNQGDYGAAAAVYLDMPAFFKAEARYVATYLKWAAAEYDSGNTEQARKLLIAEIDSARFAAVQDEMTYQLGCWAEAAGDLADALKLFRQCADYSSSGQKSSYWKISDISFRIAEQYEADGKLIEAYQLYNQIKNTSADAGSKIARKKSAMTAESDDLKARISTAVTANDFAAAQVLFTQMDQIEQDFHAMFDQYLTAPKDIQKLDDGIYEAESVYLISQLFDQYDLAMSDGNFTTAVECLQKVHAVNQESVKYLDREIVSEDEIEDRYYDAAYMILINSPKDTLQTKLVGNAFIKTGDAYDGGQKTNRIRKGQAFGLKYYNIKTTAAIHTKWYQMQMDYLQTEAKPVLFEEGDVEAWSYDMGHYSYYPASGSAKFDAGFYMIELVYHDVLGNDVTIGQFYFQITDDAVL